MDEAERNYRSETGYFGRPTTALTEMSAYWRPDRPFEPLPPLPPVKPTKQSWMRKLKLKLINFLTERVA